MIWSCDSPMNRLRATFGFIFSGGLLIFLSPYLIPEAAIKNLPWSVPMTVIPIYAGLSYGAFKLFWPHTIGKAGTTTQEKDEPNRRN
jgi:phosphotransferase system  glucose/maltose/N-acetylglucosamine-specific IIC component